MAEHRDMILLDPQPPAPDLNDLIPAVWRPKRPEDRGDINFHCPTCGTLLVIEMGESFIPRAGRVSA